VCMCAILILQVLVFLLFFIFLGQFYKIGDVSALYLSDA